VPTPEHSGPDTSHSGCTQTVGPPTLAVLGPAAETVEVAPAAAAAAIGVPLVVIEVEVVRGPAFRRAVAASVTELLEVVAVPRSESGAARGCRSATETVAIGGAAEQRVAVVVGPGAVAESEAGQEIGSALAAGEPLVVEAALAEESRMSAGCPALDKAVRMPSGAGVVGPVGLVAMGVALGAETALEVVAPHKTTYDSRQHGDLE